MIRIIIAVILIIFYMSRGISYGIYTIRDKNIAGGVSVFILILAAAVIQCVIAF